MEVPVCAVCHTVNLNSEMEKKSKLCQLCSDHAMSWMTKPDESTPEYAAFWESVDRYAEACGGTIDHTRCRLEAAAILYERLVFLLNREKKRAV
jgi:hypothetical protein